MFCIERKNVINFHVHLESIVRTSFMFKEMKDVPKRMANTLQHIYNPKISTDDAHTHVEGFFPHDPKKSEILEILQTMKSMLKKTFQCNELLEI